MRKTWVPGPLNVETTVKIDTCSTPELCWSGISVGIWCNFATFNTDGNRVDNIDSIDPSRCSWSEGKDGPRVTIWKSVLSNTVIFVMPGVRKNSSYWKHVYQYFSRIKSVTLSVLEAEVRLLTENHRFLAENLVFYCIPYLILLFFSVSGT